MGLTGQLEREAWSGPRRRGGIDASGRKHWQPEKSGQKRPRPRLVSEVPLWLEERGTAFLMLGHGERV